MKSNKKSALLRVVAMTLSVLMIGSALLMAMPLFASAAEESTNYLEYPISDYTPGEDCYDPIPLLIIMINFDADGDGVDDNPDGSGYDRVKKAENPEYGEQWCHTTEEDWVNILLSDEGATLNTYYKHMSDGKFYWETVEETSGTPNNGVISVTINNKHPNVVSTTADGKPGQWVHCFGQIIEAASQYVDFSKYDKNGNGKIEKYELGLAFILGGAETSSGSTTRTEVFGFHAYYKDFDRNNQAEVDGVNVGASGFFGTGAISKGAPLPFGVFAHELGHYLGAPDLYDTKNAGGEGFDWAVRSFCIMANGTHGSSPSHFNPYLLARFGFVNPTEVNADGEYTLYSKTSSEGKYNVLKISTPNPGEYYLIENRYSDTTGTNVTGTNFDSSCMHQGIFVWHIDENIHSKTGMTANNESDGFDPSVIIYAPRMYANTPATSVLQDGGAFYISATSDNYGVFDPKGYVFPKSKTWYTSMTAEEAKVLENLKVEIISEKGEEMKVRVTGSYDLKEHPEFSMLASDTTQTSFVVNGAIETLNYSVLQEAIFTISEVSTGKVIKTEPLKFAEDYTFKVACDGLTAGTEYKYEIAYKSDFGEGKTSKTVYTNSVVVEKAKVTLVINSDRYKKPMTQNVNVGNTLDVSKISLEKKGYKFDGWYLDEACTQEYDFAPIASAGEFTLYAKWVVDDTQTTTTTVQTTTPANTTAPDNVTDPGTSNNNMNATTIVVIAVVAVAVIGGGAVAVVIVNKKKK